jgi:hypothetical protein
MFPGRNFSSSGAVPEINWRSPLASKLSVAWLGSFPSYELVNRMSAPIISLVDGDHHAGITRFGKAFHFSNVASYIDLVPTTGDMIRLPSTAGSITLSWRKTDATLRTGNAFGNQHFANDLSRMNVYLPFSDGVVYWDFGGETTGTSRITASGLTFGDDVWTFTAGPRGMDIWQNARQVASQSSSVTREQNGTSFHLNQSFSPSTNGDLADCAFIYVHNRQLSPIEIVTLHATPFAIIAKSRATEIALMSQEGVVGGTPGVLMRGAPRGIARGLSR